MTDLRDRGVPHGTRTEASRVKVDALTAARFEDVWPEAERRLLGLLSRHDVPRSRAEDFVQEAAFRVLDSGVPYDDADDLFRWAAVVVRRLAIDAWRHDRHLAEDAALVRRAGDVDVPHEVDRRLALQAVVDAWPSLSDGDRRTIVLAVEERVTDVGAAEHSARYRARAKLRAAVRGVIGWLGVTQARRSLKAGSVVAVPVAVAWLALPLILGLTWPSGARPARRANGPAASGFAERDRTALGPTPPVAAPRGAGNAPVAGPAPTPSSRVTRLGREVPGGSVWVERDPDASGPLMCTDLGPPIGYHCTPRIGPLLPTPLPSVAPIP